MPNVVVSQDVDTLLTKSSKTEVLSYLGISDNTSNIADNASNIADNASNIADNTSNIATNTSDISANTAQIALQDGYLYVNSSNIATNTADIATNTANIATNATNIATKQDILTFGIANTNAVKIDNTNSPANSGDICKFAGSGIMPYKYANLKYDLGVDLKAPIADPDFTGTVGIAKSGVNGVLDIDGDVWQEGGKIYGETGSLDLQNNIAQLILGTSKSDAVKVERVDASSTLIFGVDASSATTGKATMLNAEVSNDLTVNGKAFIEKIESDGDILLDAVHDVTISANCGITGDLYVNGDHTINTGKLIAREIQCQGGTSSTALPINYDAREHRFRDFNETPSDLMVIKMIAGEGGRVGINTDNPKCALHIVQEGSDGYPDDEAIRCTGGLRISNWLRLGPYTDSERDAIGLDPPEGLMIYNEEHYEVQVFIGNPSGSGRGSWKAFTLQDVST